METAAVEHFGTTDSFRTAGYLLTDRQMLDFSGAHWLEGYDEKYIADWRSKNDIRQVDHEDIFEAYEALGKEFPSDSALAFMKRGNIRLVPEARGIEVYSGREPTAAQYRMIREFVREMADGSFTVDLTKDRRHRAGTLQYSGKVSAERVVNDIKQFYKTGEIRQQSTVSQFFSREDVKPEELAQKLKESEAARARVERALRVAKKQAEYWRSEHDKPGKNGIYRANPSDIRKFANAILAEYQWTTVKASDISERLTQITEGFMRQEDTADLYNIALEIANEIIDNSFVRIDNEMNIRGLDSKTDADWIKEHLKGTSGYVYIAKQDQADIASQLGEDYGNFRKRWQKYGIRLTSEIGTAARKGSLRTIDSLYNEIASLYGLKENVYTISEMVEILDAAMTEDLVNPYYDSRSELSWSDWDYVTELAEMIYEGAISGEVRQYWTRAERAERKADMEKAHLVNKLADTREALQEAKEQGRLDKNRSAVYVHTVEQRCSSGFPHPDGRFSFFPER